MVGAVVGMIASSFISEGAEAIGMAIKLAGFGYIVGYPIGVVIRAGIVRWSTKGHK
jgi:hypothetical protein